jgi:serine/threonine protein kinase
MKIENLCIHCMKEKHSADEICPFCGSDPKSADIPPYHLQPFSILAGKYLLGMAIGEGGFGITYIGMDLNLEMRVAIKEYYPNGCAVRNCSESNTVLSYSNSAQEVFEKGREKFINEARLLAKCSNLSEIVSVKDFFRENHTAYIVMEYIEGITLKAYLKQNGDHIPAQKTLQMMKPVICSLSKVHDMNLIHRDISPDNIMICNNGSVKILDFGGARDYIFSNEKSLSIMLKPGYAPEEQYRTHGNQGPWTDVYALCATMYRCITGSVPPESLERAYQESLPPIRSISPDCPPAAASAIEKGMSIYPENRFQSMQELYSALYESSQSFSDTPEPQKRSKRKGLKIFLVICLFVIAFILVMYLTHDQVLTINISAKTETTNFISQADIRS